MSQIGKSQLTVLLVRLYEIIHYLEGSKVRKSHPEGSLRHLLVLYVSKLAGQMSQ